MTTFDPAELTPAQEYDEARQSDPDYYRCPHCDKPEPDVTSGSSPGFAGGGTYWVTWQCCGVTDVDESRDVSAAQ